MRTFILIAFFSGIISLAFAAKVTIEVRSAYDDSRIFDAEILICNVFDAVKEVIDLDKKGQAKIDFKRSVYFKIEPKDNRYFGGTYRFKKDEIQDLEVVYIFPEPIYEKIILDSLGCKGIEESIGNNRSNQKSKDSITTAIFPGGYQAMSNYLEESIVYPEESMINGDQGKVWISFIIAKDGSIVCAHLLRSVSKRIGAEALRVVRLMPNWMPAKINGDPVRARVRIPISFALN